MDKLLDEIMEQLKMYYEREFNSHNYCATSAICNCKDVVAECFCEYKEKISDV